MDMPNITMMDDPVDIENMFETYDYAHRWVQQKIEASTLFKQVFLSVKDARWLKNEMKGIYHNVLTLKESVTHMDQYGRMQRALARLVDQTKDMYVTGPPNESCVEFKYFYQVTELDENAETNFGRYQVQPGHHEAYDQSDNPELQVQDSMKPPSSNDNGEVSPGINFSWLEKNPTDRIPPSNANGEVSPGIDFSWLEKKTPDRPPPSNANGEVSPGIDFSWLENKTPNRIENSSITVNHFHFHGPTQLQFQSNSTSTWQPRSGGGSGARRT